MYMSVHTLLFKKNVFPLMYADFFSNILKNLIAKQCLLSYETVKLTDNTNIQTQLTSKINTPL